MIEYSRSAGSDLIGGRLYNLLPPDPPDLMVIQAYAANQDVLISVTNTVYSPYAEVSRYLSAADALGRRMYTETSGTAFAQTAFNQWGYNSKSELESSRRYTGYQTPTPPPENEVLAEKRLYGYDQIGNRLESTEGTASATTYGANDVNAYDWVQPPSPDPQEYFCYDEDGNLLRDGKTTANCPGTDGLREYKWDAENRLIEVVPISPDDGDKKAKFVYDYMGRRVRKEVFIYDDGWPQDNDPDEQWHFVYDGWNVVMVLDGLNSNATTRKYTWGLDLSGSIHGAGGIGGLLACEEPQAVGDPKRYWFLYDANGNMGQVLDATDTGNITIAARYEYDPYGNPIPIPQPPGPGPYADLNPFRFSTKWFDEETGLGYWGYRYYSPRLGRWISRDPIGEAGGLNYYSFVCNSTIGYVDSNGLYHFGGGDPPGWRHFGPPPAVNVGTITLEARSCTTGASVLISVGVEMEETGRLRLIYDNKAHALETSGLSKAEQRIARDALQEKYYELQTKFGKAYSDAYRRVKPKPVGVGNPSSPSKRVTTIGKRFKWGGGCMIAVGITIDVVAIVETPSGERPKVVARTVGSNIGGFVGTAGEMWVVAKAGALCGAPAGPIGIGIGGVVGAIAGALAGDIIAETIYDIMPPSTSD